MTAYFRVGLTTAVVVAGRSIISLKKAISSIAIQTVSGNQPKREISGGQCTAFDGIKISTPNL